MPIKKDIIYPVFFECCEYAEDNFWKYIFEDLACGKTPYGTYISKNFLCCSYKNKEFSYKIERKDPKILYDDVYNLLTKKLGILSKKEKVIKRVTFHEVESRIKKYREEWSNIRKKNIKDILIERYVSDVKQKYLLSVKQAKRLLSIIFMAIVFKVITSDDIDYHDGKIYNIKGFEYTQSNVVFKRQLYDTDVNISPLCEQDTKKMSDNWEKYLINLRKIKLRSN